MNISVRLEIQGGKTMNYKHFKNIPLVILKFVLSRA